MLVAVLGIGWQNHAASAELDCGAMADSLNPGDRYAFKLEIQSKMIRLEKGDDFCTEPAKDWFKRQAREHIAPRVREKAQALDKQAGRITIRDTKSRWGSCSPDGNLSFCWRLVMAPDAVLDYVVAHEVAHLAELNHGPKFWRRVGELTADVEGSKQWLRLNGEALHRYG